MPGGLRWRSLNKRRDSFMGTLLQPVVTHWAWNRAITRSWPSTVRLDLGSCHSTNEADGIKRKPSKRDPVEIPREYLILICSVQQVKLIKSTGVLSLSVEARNAPFASNEAHLSDPLPTLEPLRTSLSIPSATQQKVAKKRGTTPWRSSPAVFCLSSRTLPLSRSLPTYTPFFVD